MKDETTETPRFSAHAVIESPGTLLSGAGGRSSLGTGLLLAVSPGPGAKFSKTLQHPNASTPEPRGCVCFPVIRSRPGDGSSHCSHLGGAGDTEATRNVNVRVQRHGRRWHRQENDLRMCRPGMGGMTSTSYLLTNMWE